MRFLLLPLLLLSGMLIAQNPDTINISENLTLLRLNETTYIHQSFLQTRNAGKVSCNGLLMIQENEAILADTPASIIASQELKTWLADNKISVKAIFPTHFHEDCIAGIGVLASDKSQVHFYYKTDSLMRQKDRQQVANIYKADTSVEFGNTKLKMFFSGSGHTYDNIVAWLPSEKILFGGCLIKSLNASKGYTGDANTTTWSQSAKYVKANIDTSAVVVPGHGSHGGIELLDYTIQLFLKQ